MSTDLKSQGVGQKAGRKYGPGDWDAVRAAFASSIMVDTSLANLAQNLDIPEWPVGGAEETPAKYLEYSYDELTQLPQFVLHPQRVDHLITILKETLAFDEPFGDMVAAEVGQASRDNPVKKNLAKLGIPEDFPMSLVALSPETREFCRLESLNTIGEFALFVQGMAQNAIVGGDFRALLNALSHVDESTLAMYLPYRPGTKGLHLIEGIAIAVRAYPVPTRAGLAKAFGARLGADDAAAASTASDLDIEAAGKTLAEHTAAYVEHFEADLAVLQQQVNEGVALGRLATVLKDPLVEWVVTSLLKPYLSVPNPKSAVQTTTPPVERSVEKRGFFASLLRMFKS
jgi:hypothetical protein